MQLSIVIPTFNRADDLKLCLESILKQDFSKNNYEIIVVDNGLSTDRTMFYMENFCEKNGNIKWIKTFERGVVRARKLGVEKAKGEFILQLDDDTELINANTLKILMDLFSQNHNYDCIAGLTVEDSNKKSPPLNIGTISKYGVVYTNFSGINSLDKQEIEIDHARSCFLAYKKTIYEKINGLDYIYDDLTKGMGFREETDFCYRIKKNGGKIILSKKLIFRHKASKRPQGVQERGKGLKHFYYVYLTHSFFVFKNIEINKIKWFFFQMFIGNSRVPGLFYIIKRRLNPVLFLILPFCILKTFLLSKNR